ncbi:MAG: ATP-binding protein [Spirochaetes bacterium]|nr:ATP-binding protein [Spirochaetota bacterium]
MLSAGIAHEINNPLSSIMANAQNLINDEDNEEKKVSLKWIEKETRRIAGIIKNLLDFSTSNHQQDNQSDVNQIIPEIINLINYSLKKENQITIKPVLAQNSSLICINQDELKQILINLIKNSIQAIEKNGKIIVKTTKNKNNINIFIIDNGVGIKPEVIPHIFDPFFTTKENNMGTGLGLSIVYGIVTKYKGSIKVNSTVGKGTEFMITLPAVRT